MRKTKKYNHKPIYNKLRDIAELHDSDGNDHIVHTARAFMSRYINALAENKRTENTFLHIQTEEFIRRTKNIDNVISITTRKDKSDSKRVERNSLISIIRTALRSLEGFKHRADGQNIKAYLEKQISQLEKR